MIRVSICDDDVNILEVVTEMVEQMLHERNSTVQIKTYLSGEQLLFETEDNQCFTDILIMDIIMNKLNGLDTCKELRKRGFDGTIIFLSTSKNYAIDAYEVGAVSYVMKEDLKTGKFEHAFHKALELSKHEASQKMMILNNKTVYSLDLRNIIYFESNLKKVIANEVDQSYTFYGKFEDVATAVEDKKFIRCHKSYLVNCAYVKSFSPTEIVCTGGTILPMGRTHYKSFKEAFLKYLKGAVQL